MRNVALLAVMATLGIASAACNAKDPGMAPGHNENKGNSVVNKPANGTPGDATPPTRIDVEAECTQFLETIPRGAKVTLHTASPEKAAITVDVEVVKTPEFRAQGLMCRKSMDEMVGMLFIMDERDIHSFWMKNTHLPLDIIFIDEDFTIAGIAKYAKPLTLSSRSVDKPSRYVLELNAGWSDKYHLQAGQKVEFIDIAKYAN